MKIPPVKVVFNKEDRYDILNEIDEVQIFNGFRKRSELKLINKIFNFFGLTPRVLIIKLKNNGECFFKCIEDPLNICEEYYQLL